MNNKIPPVRYHRQRVPPNLEGICETCINNTSCPLKENDNDFAMNCTEGQGFFNVLTGKASYTITHCIRFEERSDIVEFFKRRDMDDVVWRMR